MRRIGTMFLATVMLIAPATLDAAEIIRITHDNYDQIVPAGKEVDAIVGDYLMRNDRIVAVIADPIEGRNANMQTRNAGGAVIDLTRRDVQSDQLTAIYPAGTATSFRKAAVKVGKGPRVVLVCESAPAPGEPNVTVTYTLEDGRDDLHILTTYTNRTGQELVIEPTDEVRADKGFGGEIDGSVAWVVDDWWGQAYGFVPDKPTTGLTRGKGTRPWRMEYAPQGNAKVTLAAGQSVSVGRHVIPAGDVLRVRTKAANLQGQTTMPVSVHVTDPRGFVPDAVVTVSADKKVWGSGRTDYYGRLEFALPPGQWDVEIAAFGRTTQNHKIDASARTDLKIVMDAPGYAVLSITDDQRQPIPAKVQFVGTNGTPNPFWFPDTGEHLVHNVYYTQHGRLLALLAPGTYDVIISYGPEYDVVKSPLKIARGQYANIRATLTRTVDSSGWISSDIHSHASPSGDNTASQLGRVLNLLCENIEFAPCTEHNRLDSYTPHLRRLGVEHLMATAIGIELTGASQNAFNHHNAFPLTMKPRTQDNGAPLTDLDPFVQIQRLYNWEDGSEKLLQQNHPNIIQLGFDKDLDGKADGGFNSDFKFMHAIELHPPQNILNPPSVKEGVASGVNRIAAWLQILNQGHRVPGMINADAHYNFHGSGHYRNYIRSSQDHPARIDLDEIIRNIKAGRVVMSTAPFMEVALTAGKATAIPGEDLLAKGGKASLSVKVQCANWYDINRVQVFVNGRPDPKLNFTRTSHPKMFADDVVKFDQKIPLALEADAHIIVVAVGEGLTLQPVFPEGTLGGRTPPIAVSNPIFVDIDGKGFAPNRDELGAPLPR